MRQKDYRNFLKQFSLTDEFLGEDPTMVLDANREMATEESGGGSNAMAAMKAIIGGDVALAGKGKGEPIDDVKAAKAVAEGPKDDRAIYTAQEDKVFRDDAPYNAETGVVNAKFLSAEAKPGTLRNTAEEEPLGKGEVRQAAYRTGDMELIPENKVLADKRRQLEERYTKFNRDWPAWLPIGHRIRSRVASAMGSELDMARYSSNEAQQDFARKQKAQKEIDTKFTHAYQMSDNNVAFLNPEKGTMEVRQGPKPEDYIVREEIGPNGEIGYVRKSGKFEPTGRYTSHPTARGVAVGGPRGYTQKAFPSPEPSPDEKAESAALVRQRNASAALDEARRGEVGEPKQMSREKLMGDLFGMYQRALSSGTIGSETSFEDFSEPYLRNVGGEVGKRWSPAPGASTPPPAPSHATPPGSGVPFEQLTEQQLRALPATRDKNGDIIVTYQGKSHVLRKK